MKLVAGEGGQLRLDAAGRAHRIEPFRAPPGRHAIVLLHAADAETLKLAAADAAALRALVEADDKQPSALPPSVSVEVLRYEGGAGE